MHTEPAIIGNPELGITESEFEDVTITDNRTPGRGYPYIEPRDNPPKDDMNRLNHALKKIDQDISNLHLASMVGLDAYLFS